MTVRRPLSQPRTPRMAHDRSRSCAVGLSCKVFHLWNKDDSFHSVLVKTGRWILWLLRSDEETMRRQQMNENIGRSASGVVCSGVKGRKLQIAIPGPHEQHMTGVLYVQCTLLHQSSISWTWQTMPGVGQGHRKYRVDQALELNCSNIL